MPDITIPKLNTIDTSYTLVEWLFPEGAEVPPDSAVAVVETSKAAAELVCDEGGILHRIAEPPAECEAGAVIGRLFATDAERLAAPQRPVRRPPPSEPRDGRPVRVHRAARAAGWAHRHQSRARPDCQARHHRG